MLPAEWRDNSINAGEYKQLETFTTLKLWAEEQTFRHNFHSNILASTITATITSETCLQQHNDDEFIKVYFFWRVVTVARSISYASLEQSDGPTPLSFLRKTLLRLPASAMLSSSLLQLGVLLRLTTTFFSCLSIMRIPERIVRRTTRLKQLSISLIIAGNYTMKASARTALQVINKVLTWQVWRRRQELVEESGACQYPGTRETPPPPLQMLPAESAAAPPDTSIFQCLSNIIYRNIFLHSPLRSSREPSPWQSCFQLIHTNNFLDKCATFQQLLYFNVSQQMNSISVQFSWFSPSLVAGVWT